MGNLGRKMRKTPTSAAAIPALMARARSTVEVDPPCVGLLPPVDWAEAKVAAPQRVRRAIAHDE